MIQDPLIPLPRPGGFGEELARFAAANRSIARHRRRARWMRLRAAVFGRRKTRLVPDQASAGLVCVQAVPCRAT